MLPSVTRQPLPVGEIRTLSTKENKLSSLLDRRQLTMTYQQLPWNHHLINLYIFSAETLYSGKKTFLRQGFYDTSMTILVTNQRPDANIGETRINLE